MLAAVSLGLSFVALIVALRVAVVIGGLRVSWDRAAAMATNTHIRLEGVGGVEERVRALEAYHPSGYTGSSTMTLPQTMRGYDVDCTKQFGFLCAYTSPLGTGLDRLPACKDVQGGTGGACRW